MKKRILLSASIFHALTDASTVIIPTIFPILYSQGFLITRYSQIGLLSNLGLFTTLLIQFFVVRFSYRRDYRNLLFGSGLAMCASLALVPFARSFAALLVFFILMRLATSIYHPLIIAWVSKSRSGSGKELDDAMGIQSGSGNVGVGLAYLTVGFLAQRWTWKTPFFVWSIFGLVLVAFGMLALRGVATRNEEARPALGARSWARSLSGVKRYIPGFFFGGMGWSVTIFYAPSLLNHRFQIPMGQTGLFLALWIGLGTVTGYAYGFLSRRFGRKNIFLITLGGAVACLFVIGFAPAKAVAVAALVAFGGFLLMTYPSLHTFVGSTVPPEGQTQAFSWISNIQLISGALVSLVSGFLSDWIGIHTPFILTGILTLGIFLFYLPRGPERWKGRHPLIRGEFFNTINGRGPEIMKKHPAGFWGAAVLILGITTAPMTAREAIDVLRVPNPLAVSGRWVEDAGGVLGPEYTSLINSACEALKNKTSAELAVVTVDDLGGLTIEDFAARLFKRFGIGVAGKENGILLLFSRDDRKVRFEVGYGLEGTIPDAAASRILDEQALPFFKENQYGRGLYAAVKTAAAAISAAAGAPLELSDPAIWPPQIALPTPVSETPAGTPGKTVAKPDPLPASLISGAAVVLFMILGFLFVSARVARIKAKMSKEKAIKGSGAVIALTWTGSIIGFVILASITKSILPFLLSFGLVPAAATFGHVRVMKSLRKKIAAYQAPCEKCGRPMRLLDDQEDDAFLSAEEIAEESAGGMNYEIWECDPCKTTERFSMKLGRADACPRCKRRTLVTRTTTLAAATTSSGGRVRVDAECRNPACDYKKSVERRTARLAPPTSGSSRSGSSSGGSSRSSFGGGRSGGGGASKSW